LGGCKIWLYAGTSEYPALLARSAGSDNASGADDQQERPGHLEWTGILRGHTPDARTRAMRWSDLHGDMESWAEQKRPSHGQPECYSLRWCVTRVPKVE
jgi:hypothetical protein